MLKQKLTALLLIVCMILVSVQTFASESETNISFLDKSKTGTEDVYFGDMNDPDLIPYMEDKIYFNLVDDIGDGYVVNDVQAVYLSKEYLADLEYNSRENVYFGYTLSELDKKFDGKKYVFTLGDDGQTTVEELQELTDDTGTQVLKNVAVGGGVILLCVTVSAATGGVAPAVSMIFAVAADTGTKLALSSGAIGFAAASIVKGYQTEDLDQALKAGALAGSEGFKWGAIIGGATGGATEGLMLKAATLNGLTMNEVAMIQKESKWPLDAIRSIHSTAEYEIYKDAGVVPTRISKDTWALTRKIDWNLTDEFGRTNVQRVGQNLAPIDSDGIPYELHHIGQKADSPLAILTKSEHHSSENFSILHYAEEGKGVTEADWLKQKNEFWKTILKMAQKGEL